MQYCPQCGAERVVDARFCHSCGGAFPGASRQVLVLGLCGVLFLAGISYFIIQTIQGSEAPVTAPTTEHVHVEGDDHGASQAAGANNTVAGQTSVHEQKLGAAGTRFAPLETYFRNHEIVGPKVFSFKVESEDAAVLYLDQFPMDQMPPVARQVFDAKVQAQLKELGEGVHLEIRDARNRGILANYNN